MRSALVLFAFCTVVASASDNAEAPATAAVNAEAKPESEKTIRARFVLTYTSAQTPAAKAAAVKKLRGVSEKESLRMLAGMLGDSEEAVRVAACQSMSATFDDEGYFVKPLMGALTDSSIDVRIAAADALGSAQIKADAVKALVYGLLAVAGKSGDDQKHPEKNAALQITAYNSALERLAGEKCKETAALALSTFWTDYWKQNEDGFRDKDREKLGPEVVPVRPKDAKPDSFDHMEAKSE